MSDVTVIIPTLNGEQWLDQLLGRLRAQQGVPSLEIMVIDSGSRDRTLTIARAHGVRIEQTGPEGFDHAGTRTRAAVMATGDVLVYFTQDALPENDQCLAELLKPLAADQRLAASYGRQLPHARSSLFAKHLRWYNYGDRSETRGREDRERLGLRTVFISNSCAAWQRAPLAAIGYFGHDQLFGEDSLALARLLDQGWRVAYAAEARVIHAHDYTLGQEFRRYFDVGVFHRSQEWLLREYGRAGGAGRGYVVSEMRRIVRDRRYSLLPLAVFRNLVKYLGYRTGLGYRFLPGFLCPRLSMNPAWWRKKRQ